MGGGGPRGIYVNFCFARNIQNNKKKKKNKKKNFGENLKPYKVPNQLLWKISVLSHHVDFSYRYTWTWKSLSTKRTVFYTDLHEHKKKPIWNSTILPFYKIAWTEKNIWNATTLLFYGFAWTEKKTHLEFYNVYSNIHVYKYKMV